MRVVESPNGTYAVRVEPWEARMSLWVETPQIIDCHSGAVLFAFSDERWSLERATWLSASVVHLLLRKFPGDHLPTSVEAVVDCMQATATVGSAAPCSIARLEQQLEASLTPRPKI